MEGKQVAYLATEATKKVIGLGQADKLSTAIRPDDVLKWELPAKWSVAQSVPIPFNYAMAYYALHIAAQADAHRSIAITDGRSKLGLACLRVALALTTDVFVFVGNDQEKKELKTMLPKLVDDKILINRSGSSEQLCLILRKRSPKGVDIIINTGAPDIPLLAVQCLKSFGCIVELSNKLFNTRGKLTNSYDYLISASLLSCAGNDLCDNHIDVKKQVYQLVLDGIANGVVVPYNDLQLKDWNDIKTVRIEGEKKENSRFQCEPDKAYLIIGGDAYSWISVAEWFVHRKASNIIVVPKNADLNTSLNNKLNQLQERCKIIVKAAEDITPKLIDHIFEVSRAKIALTFLMPSEQNTDVNKDVVVALQNKETYLVSVLPKTSQVIQQKNDNSTLTVLWNQSLVGRIQCFLKTFDRLLSLKQGHIIQVDDEEEEVKGQDDPYDQLLPKSLDEVLQYGESLPEDITITELKTRSPGLRVTKEITPIFVIGGLNRTEVVTRMRGILNPVLVIDFPPMGGVTVKEYASFILPKIKSLTRGPYVMVGDGWGGAVALETARILERMGEDTQLFLLASTPNDIFNKFDSLDHLDIVLLTRIFDIDAEELRKEASWAVRLNLCVARLPNEQISIVTRSLNSIRDKAASLIPLTDKVPINGSVFCISKQDNVRSSVSWMSRQEVPLTIIEPNDSLVNDSVVNMIEKNVSTRYLKKN